MSAPILVLEQLRSMLQTYNLSKVYKDVWSNLSKTNEIGVAFSVPKTLSTDNIEKISENYTVPVDRVEESISNLSTGKLTLGTGKSPGPSTASKAPVTSSTSTGRIEDASNILIHNAVDKTAVPTEEEKGNPQFSTSDITSQLGALHKLISSTASLQDQISKCLEYSGASTFDSKLIQANFELENHLDPPSEEDEEDQEGDEEEGATTSTSKKKSTKVSTPLIETIKKDNIEIVRLLGEYLVEADHSTERKTSILQLMANCLQIVGSKVSSTLAPEILGWMKGCKIPFFWKYSTESEVTKIDTITSTGSIYASTQEEIDPQILETDGQVANAVFSASYLVTILVDNNLVSDSLLETLGGKPFVDRLLTLLERPPSFLDPPELDESEDDEPYAFESYLKYQDSTANLLAEVEGPVPKADVLVKMIMKILLHFQKHCSNNVILSSLYQRTDHRTFEEELLSNINKVTSEFHVGCDFLKQVFSNPLYVDFFFLNDVKILVDILHRHLCNFTEKDPNRGILSEIFEYILSNSPLYSPDIDEELLEDGYYKEIDIQDLFSNIAEHETISEPKSLIHAKNILKIEHLFQ